ncbi:MAG: hypothetical protein KatS3mg051_0953 [Anaerolineae bacterium]|nr:MAG: hypothetical protein KatS3mg051_0953 [Anaerolineae bacterium]
MVRTIGLPPVVLCHLIAGQKLSTIPLSAYARIAVWLQMPLRNVLALAGVTPSLADLMRLGMEWRGLRANSAPRTRSRRRGRRESAWRCSGAPCMATPISARRRAPATGWRPGWAGQG